VKATSLKIESSGPAEAAVGMEVGMLYPVKPLEELERFGQRALKWSSL
jgi:hypothetical protein